MTVVNQYSRTFVGQAIANSWQFYLPQLPRQHTENYFEVEVVQLGIRRSGVSAPHEVLFFAADIQGINGGFVTSNGIIDSRLCLGIIQNYDSGAIVAQLTAPAPVTFKIPSFQPINPFTVTMFRLAEQELADAYDSVITAPKSLIPTNPIVNAQFIGQINNGVSAIVGGTTLTVETMVSPSLILAVGQTIKIDPTVTSTTYTITALGTGTGGIGTYTINTGALVNPGTFMISTSTDTVTPSQFIMTWNIKEVSPK